MSDFLAKRTLSTQKSLIARGTYVQIFGKSAKDIAQNR